MSDIHGDNHDREGQEDLNKEMEMENTPQDREALIKWKADLDIVIEKSKEFLDKFPGHDDTPVKDTSDGSFYWLVWMLAQKFNVGWPEPTMGDMLTAAELIREKIDNKMWSFKVDEQAAKALKNAEQLTVDDHGNFEVNPVPEGYHDEFDAAMILAWDDPRLARITRARWIGDPGIGVDLSYCHGVTTDGLDAYVALPYELHHIRGVTSERALRRVILDVAKKKGVYAKGTGIFEALSLLV